MTLADVTRVHVPIACIETVQEHMRNVGREGHEGMGLWVGQQVGEAFHVRQAVIPQQRHIRSADGVCVVVDADELHRLNVWLFNEGLALVGQIHSHPGRAYHSDTDDQYAIATKVGSLSLVVPDYARAPFALATTASYRLDAQGRWRSLSVGSSRALITLEP